MKNLTPLAVLIGAGVVAAAIYLGLTSTPTQPSQIVPMAPPVGTVVPPDDTVVTTAISPKILNTLDAHIQDIRTILLAVEEAFKGDHYDDIAKHADDVEALTQQIRSVATDLPTENYELISRDIREIQHGAHELEEASGNKDHEGAHHSYSTMLRFLDTLEEDVKRLE